MGESEGGDSAADAAMDRYSGGDTSAFSELYDLIAPRLHRFLLLKTRDATTAEDLVQQSLLQIHLNRARFTRGARVMPWAIAIARRLFIDSLRRAKHEHALSVDAAEALVNVIAAGALADDQLHSRKLGESIRREVDRLPSGQRDAFELVSGAGLTQAEAAEVLGTSVMAIKIRCYRAQEALRVALAPLNLVRVNDY
jgi:RNA polymerase sigma-70 factor (ECF subfamily)